MRQLVDWERHLETLSPPSRIELGLERVADVWSRLQSGSIPNVLTVAGTNGKGSAVEASGVIASQVGLRYGQYTSPHIHRIHERIRINGAVVTDDTLIDAFERVEAAQCDVFLTYFEFLTLAALVIFQDSRLDLWILEIGLGGRLDAVNMIDPNVSVITSIGLDHQAYLGDSIEAIAREKAGIMRSGIPTFTGAFNAKSVLQDEADRIGSMLRSLDDFFDLEVALLRLSECSIDLSKVSLPKNSVALACLAMDSLGHRLPVTLGAQLQQAEVLGRMTSRMIQGREWILDVGHNPAACEFVTQTLAKKVSKARRVVIFGALADKDVEMMLPLFNAYSDRVVLVGIEGERGRTIDSLEASWLDLFEQTCWRSFDTLPTALEGLPSELNLNDHVLVMGSFVLVADALNHDLFN